jgi:NTE family protein
VISYLRDELQPELDRELRLDVLTGTSVGAIHACFLAATAEAPACQGQLLVSHWLSAKLDEVLEFGFSDVLRILRESLGRPSSNSQFRHRGLVSPEGLRNLVCRIIPWLRIGRNLRKGLFDSLAVSATHISTGRTIVFVQKMGDVPRWGNDPNYLAMPARISPNYALASAAIPILFPAVRLDGQLFVDGGLRLSVPLSPALRLGSERVVVISLKHDESASARSDVATRSRAMETEPMAPTAPFLFGKTLNALLLDRTNQDLDQLRRINSILEAGTKAYGASFAKVLNDALSPHRNQPVRYVRTLRVCPSRDIGLLAADYAQSPLFRRSSSLARRVILGLVDRGLQGADLASYLLFDAGFAEILIDLGRRDARAQRTDWIRFWAEPPESAAEAAQAAPSAPAA